MPVLIMLPLLNLWMVSISQNTNFIRLNFLKSGESIRIKSNIIITESVVENAGVLTILRNPQNYWLGSVVNECFLIKSGVLSSDFVGVLHISIINKSLNPVVLKAGTNLGMLEFSKYI